VGDEGILIKAYLHLREETLEDLGIDIAVIPCPPLNDQAVHTLGFVVNRANLCSVECLVFLCSVSNVECSDLGSQVAGLRGLVCSKFQVCSV
jgi:hypothetical protein